MHKKTKFFIVLFFISIFSLFFPTTFAKYVLENTQVVARLTIDRCKPTIELVDITSSNIDYPTRANQTHLITGHIKISEKSIFRNDFSIDTLKVAVGNRYAISEQDYITPEFKNFFLLSENDTERLYEFSFTDTTGNGALVLVIPEGIVEDCSRIFQ